MLSLCIVLLRTGINGNVEACAIFPAAKKIMYCITYFLSAVLAKGMSVVFIVSSVTCTCGGVLNT